MGRLRKENDSKGMLHSVYNAESILNHIDAIICILDHEMNIYWANQSFYQKMGYAEKDILGKPFNILCNPQNHLGHINRYDPLTVSEVRCFQQNKTPTDFLIKTSEFTDNGHTFRVLSFKDITKENRLTTELVFQENKFQTVFENTFNASIITDTEGHIIECNARACEIFMYSSSELKKINRKELIIDDKHSIELWTEIVKYGRGNSNVTCRRRNGAHFKANMVSQTFYNNQVGKPLIYNILEDISEHEKLEAIIRDTNSMSQTGYFEFNFLTKENVFSPVLKEIIEVPADFVPDIVRDIAFYKEGESRNQIAELISLCIEKGRSGKANVELVTAKGNTKWVSVHVNPEFVDGKCIRMFGTFQDISKNIQLNKKASKAANELSTLLESVPDLILVIDANGRIEQSNSVSKIIWGYTPEELIGKKKMDFVHPDDIDYTENQNQQITSGSSLSNFENRYIAKDGRLVNMSWSAKWDKKEAKYYLVGRDITQKLKEEREKKFLSNLYAYNDTGAIRTDASQNIIWINEAFTKMSGYNPEDVLGTSPLSFLLGPETDAESINRLGENLKNQTTTVEELVLYNKDKSTTWIQLVVSPMLDNNGNLEGWLGLHKDISEKKANEHQTKLLQTVIEKAYDSIVITEAEPQTGTGPKIVYVNEAFEKQTGYSKAEAIGKSPKMLQGPETDPNTRKSMGEKLMKWEPVETDLLNYKKNGEKFWNRLSITPIADEKGWFTNWISIQRDVTQEREAEKIKEKEEEEIKKELTKALLKGEDNHRKLMSMELHDNISQLLTGMKLFLTQYKKNKKEAYLDESLVALDQSIKEIRELSHSMAIPDVFENAFVLHIENIITKLNAAGNITFKLDENIDQNVLNHEISINLYRIIQEQINNILKHAHANNVSISLHQENKQIRLIIKDDGVGFDTTQKSHGIGLTNIKTRISLFNGEMDIHSEPGKGCELNIVMDLN